MISERTFRTLELGKVLERLAANASFSLSREAALALRPATALSAVQELQHQTAECVRLLDMGVDVSMGGAHDIRPAVTRAERGGALDPPQLLDVRSTLECAERIARTLGRLDESYPWLQAQRHRMGHFRGITSAIAGAINDRGEVMDAASPALQRIRSELRVTHTRLVDRLNAMLASAQYRNAVQEALVTTRNGRYVIPIKAELKGQVKGIVHDQSSSGATLFIEPLAVTELNNQWHQLHLDERDEVDRILHELSAAIGQQAAAILSTVEALAAIDLGLAKARYGALRRHRRRAEHRAEPLDLQQPPDQHHLHAARPGRQHAAAARRARRGHRPDRGLGAGPRDSDLPARARRARDRHHALQRAQGLRLQ